MATEYMKLYNLPQNIEGGIKIYGSGKYRGKDAVLLFHRLDEMSSDCTIEGTDHVVHLPADTPIIYEDGEYRVGEEPK